MGNPLKIAARSTLRHLGFEVKRIKKSATATPEKIVEELPDLFDLTIEHNGGGLSSTPHKQDVFALIVNGFKRGGFFVEFGAAGGKTGSTTYTLEKTYGWTGIVAEPCVQWHAELGANRTCKIERDCVWAATGETLEFHSYKNGFRSTISEFADLVDHRASGELLETSRVRTISLLDLLKRHDAPHEIDFLSMDTEGSELDILRGFDFSQYAFRAITVEHNHREDRGAIRKILARNGYRPVFEYLSGEDDWFVPVSSAVG